MIGRDALQASGAFGSMSNAINLGLFLGLAAAFVAFAGAIALAVDNAVKFQTILIQMGRAGNLTQAQMDALGQTLMDIGGHSIFSIEELGQAFVVLLQRGVSAGDIMKYVGQQATYLAEATGMKAVPAAQLLASTLISFHIPAADAAKTVDLLQFAIEHGIGPSDSLAAALTKLGSIAFVLHLSLADIIPAFDILSRATGSYSLAATNLYYFLNQVKFGTSTYRDEIQKLGISFYDTQGNFIGLNNALSLLYKTLQNKSPQEAAKILGELFNIRSSQGIAILEQSLKDVYGLTQKLAQSHDNLGVAMDRAKQAEQSAAGLWQSLRTNLQDVLTLMGGPFLAVIQPLLSRLNDLSIRLRQFMAENPRLGAMFVALGAAIAGVGVIVAIAMSPLGGLIGIMLLVMAVVAGIAAVVMNASKWFKQLYADTGMVGTVFRTVWAVLVMFWGIIKDIGAYAASQFIPVWKSLQQNFKDILPELRQFGSFMMTWVLPILAMVAAIILGVVIGAIHGLISALAWLITGLGFVLKGIIQFVGGVVNFFTGLFQLILGLATKNTSLVQEAWHKMGAGIMGILGGLGSMITGFFIGLGGAVIGFVIGFVHGIISWFQNLSNLLVGHSIIPNMVNAIISFFASLPGRALAAVGALLGMMLGWANGVWHGVQGAVSNGVNTVIGIVQGLPGRVLGAIGGLAGAMYNAGRNIIQGLVNGIWSAFGWIQSAISSVTGWIASHLPFSPVKMGPLVGIENSGLKLMQMVADGINQGAPLVHAAMDKATGGMLGVPGMSRINTPINMGGIGGVGMGGVQPLVINLDGKVIYDNTMNRIRGDLQMNGFGRAFR